MNAHDNNINTTRPSAVPFLITHWLSQYGRDTPDDENLAEGRAIARIQSATLELAQAFAELGAFGTTVVRRSHLYPPENEGDSIRLWVSCCPALYFLHPFIKNDFANLFLFEKVK